MNGFNTLAGMLKIWYFDSVDVTVRFFSSTARCSAQTFRMYNNLKDFNSTLNVNSNFVSVQIPHTADRYLRRRNYRARNLELIKIWD